MKDQPKETVMSEQDSVQAFAKEYQELCEKHGYRIVVSPAYIARDDGSFSTILQHGVEKLPKNEQ